MKTLRKLLFERHREAGPGLDLARKEFLARLSGAQSPPRPEPHVFERLWHDCILPLRWHLAGMSAVWLAVLVLHCDASPAPAAAVARENTAHPHQVLAALLQRRQEVLDLTGPPPPASVSLPPRRSEAVPATLIA